MFICRSSKMNDALNEEAGEFQILRPQKKNIKIGKLLNVTTVRVTTTTHHSVWRNYAPDILFQIFSLKPRKQ